MAKKANRRVRSPRASKPRGASTRRGRTARARVDPAERKVRNRTFLFLGLLAAVNAYVFFGRGDAAWADLSAIRPAAIGARAGAGNPLGAHADPPRRACSGDPTRIFAGLHGLLHQSAELDGAFAPALARLGIDPAQIAAIEAAIRPTLDLGLVAGTGAPLRIARDRHGLVHALELEIAEGQLLQACRAGDALDVRTLHHPATTDLATVELVLGPAADLLAAIAAAGEAPELADRLADALAHDLDLQTELHPGDRLRVVVEKRLLGERFHRYGAVLGLRYQGAAGAITAIRTRDPRGELALYTPDGLPLARALRRTPIGFHALPADARGHLAPTTEVVAGRLGAMYRRPEGAPVVALADGVVRRAGVHGDAGLVVELLHPGDLIVRYSHLSQVVGDLEPATTVRAGQLVGLAGHSGRAASDRVRVEMWREEGGAEVFVDPLHIHSGDARPERRGEPLRGDALARFERDTAPLRRLLR